MKNIVITLWMLRKGDNLARSVSYALCDHYNYQPSSNLYSICRLQVHILIVIHLSACSHFLLNSSLSCPYIVTYPHNIRVCMLTRTRISSCAICTASWCWCLAKLVFCEQEFPKFLNRRSVMNNVFNIRIFRCTVSVDGVICSQWQVVLLAIFETFLSFYNK